MAENEARSGNESASSVPEMTETDKQAATFAEEDVRVRDVAPAIEFMCWLIVALAPILRWVNGPAVTEDQFVIQLAFVSMAAAGAVGIRVHTWWQKRAKT